jgi:hypothetical protein
MRSFGFSGNSSANRDSVAIPCAFSDYFLDHNSRRIPVEPYKRLNDSAGRGEHRQAVASRRNYELSLIIPWSWVRSPPAPQEEQAPQAPSVSNNRSRALDHSGCAETSSEGAAKANDFAHR